MSSEAPPRSILSRTATGAGWMFAWRLSTRLLGLISTLVLVRLLTPEDFGLFSLAFTVIATLETMLAIGMEAQLIRARQTSRALYDTVFTINVIRGTLLALLMVAFAGPAGAFFREPRLEVVLLVLALIPLLAGVNNVGTAEFSRELDFAKVFKLLIVPRLLQIVVTLVAAVVLQSHWALVFGAVFGRVLATLFSYVFHAFRPHPHHRRRSLGWVPMRRTGAQR
jgi:lipopolysaccharide exporter